MKGESGGTLYYLLVLQVVMVSLFSAFSYSMSEINCPDLGGTTTSGFNEGNQSVTQSNWLGWITILTGSCSGIPSWTWLLVFLPAIVAIVAIILPNWISGA